MGKNKNFFAAAAGRLFVWLLAATCMVFLSGSVTAEAATPSISKKSQTMKVGQSVTLQVKNANAKVTWSTSNKKIVKITSKSGSKKQKAKIQALKAGKATITAKVGSKKFKVKVTVKSFTINKKKATVNEGKTITLTAKNPGKTVTWTTSNKKVAKIVKKSGTNKSKVTIQGVKPGTATITGKIGSVKVTAKITVKHVHKYSIAATCTTPKQCACGATKGSPAGHKPGDAATCTKDQKCKKCNVVLKKKLGHKAGDAATCTEDQKCTRCNAVLKEKLGHVPGDAATCTTPQRCLECHVVLKEKLGHVPGDAATCTTPQKCTRCKIELEEALGHSPGNAATCTTDQKCTRCNAVLERASGHDFGRSGKCKCGEHDLYQFLGFGILDINDGIDDQYADIAFINVSQDYSLVICGGTRTVTGKVVMDGVAVPAQLVGWSNGSEYIFPTEEFKGTNTRGAFALKMSESRTLPFGTTVEFDIIFDHQKYHLVVETAGDANNMTYMDLLNARSYTYTKY